MFKTFTITLNLLMRLPMHLTRIILRVLLILIISMGALPLQAQEQREFLPDKTDSLNLILKQLASTGMPGNVTIIPHDERILNLLWRHVNYNDSIGIYGWKVLLYNGRSRTAAIEAESLFLNSFPDTQIPTRVVYPEPPDFKTVVGVYRTKEEAYKLQQQVKSVFKFCYLVYVRLDKGELD